MNKVGGVNFKGVGQSLPYNLHFLSIMQKLNFLLDRIFFFIFAKKHIIFRSAESILYEKDKKQQCACLEKDLLFGNE